MKSSWWVEPQFQAQFPSVEAVFALEGEEISKSPLSRLVKIQVNGKKYYVKRYHRAGRKFRKYIGRSRIKAEWENLLLFQSLGVPVPPIVAYGEEREGLQFIRGALIIEELVDYKDMSFFADECVNKLKDKVWLNELMAKVAQYTAKLHQVKFIHNDLKWRNLLVNETGNPLVYFIDCPVGRRRFGWLFKRGVVKDLACLDKKAKLHLSKTARLRFYCLYRQIKSLKPHHKKEIKKILSFHAGRE